MWSVAYEKFTLKLPVNQKKNLINQVKKCINSVIEIVKFLKTKQTEKKRSVSQNLDFKPWKYVRSSQCVCDPICPDPGLSETPILKLRAHQRRWKKQTFQCFVSKTKEKCSYINCVFVCTTEKKPVTVIIRLMKFSQINNRFPNNNNSKYSQNNRKIYASASQNRLSLIICQVRPAATANIGVETESNQPQEQDRKSKKT